jgi:hypothetical protein
MINSQQSSLNSNSLAPWWFHIMLADGRFGQAIEKHCLTTRAEPSEFDRQKMPTKAKDNGDDSFQTVLQVKPIYGEKGTGVVESNDGSDMDPEYGTSESETTSSEAGEDSDISNSDVETETFIQVEEPKSTSIGCGLGICLNVLFALVAILAAIYYVDPQESDSNNVIDSRTCDRQCRYYFSPDRKYSTGGFYNRRITGGRYFSFSKLQTRCECFFNRQPLRPQTPIVTSTSSGNSNANFTFADDINTRSIPHRSSKSWNTSHFWCNEYSTALVCVQRIGTSTPVTIPRSEVKPETDTTLHCGQCAACSNLHDMVMMNRTRKNITVSSC